MNLAEIKSAVRELSPKELAELAKFVAEQDNAAWDKQMEADAASGKLDFLFEEADRERAAGQLRNWPGESEVEMLAPLLEAARCAAASCAEVGQKELRSLATRSQLSFTRFQEIEGRQR
jgi:hypothetical protein